MNNICVNCGGMLFPATGYNSQFGGRTCQCAGLANELSMARFAGVGNNVHQVPSPGTTEWFTAWRAEQANEVAALKEQIKMLIEKIGKPLIKVETRYCSGCDKVWPNEKSYMEHNCDHNNSM